MQHTMHTDLMQPQVYYEDTQHAEMMRGMYGAYPITRDSSGTDWLPSSNPMEAIHFEKKEWVIMLHGFSYLIFDHQRGKRGNKKVFDENMFQCTAQRNAEHDTFALRTMFSLEPVTIGKCGYPLLFQTGETCNGKTPLIDRQHPHDFFMELALVYSHLFDNDSSLFFYFGIPGEPALCPPVYFMRFSSEYNPEAPLAHHWIDSTHITFGVATIGFIYNQNFKVEFSTFTGREPNQHRFDIEKPTFDSFCFRLSYNPTENLALQVSSGLLKSPDQLEPNVNIVRSILSAIYNRNFHDTSNWQTSLILGINADRPGHVLPALLVDSTFEYKRTHLGFFRFESIVKDDLFVPPDPLAGIKFNINKFSFGYIFEWMTGHVKWGLGGLLDFFAISHALKESYGNINPSYMIFLQMRLV